MDEDRADGEGSASPQGKEGGQAPGYNGGWVSSSPFPSFTLLVLAFLTYLTQSIFPYRASISIDKLLKPLPTMMLEGTESSVSALLRSKRVRRGDDGGDLGCTEEKDRTSQEKACEVEEDAAGLVHQRMAVEDAAIDADATAEAGPVRMEAITEEVTATEVIRPRTTTNETATGEAAAA
jgi:hypothetical protein